MLKILFFLVLPIPLFSNSFFYTAQDNKQDFIEMIDLNNNNATYSFTKNNKFIYQASISFGNNLLNVEEVTIIKKNKTNTIYHNDKKSIMELPFVILPEIQLQSFITNQEQKMLNYIGIRLNSLQRFIVTVKKIPSDSNKIKAEFSIKNISKNIFYFIYYFNQEGFAEKKEFYFGLKKITYNQKT